MAGVIATADPDTGVDIYIGQGGAPEGVLAAAALRCVGGQMQGRLVFRNDDERRARAHGASRTSNRKYSMLDLAKGDVMFAATGVTNGAMLRGVRRSRGGHDPFARHALQDRHRARRSRPSHNFAMKPVLRPA